VVSINRVPRWSKVAGDSISARVVVVGTAKGKVGVGLAKAAEVPEAIRKGVEDAKKSLVSSAPQRLLRITA